MRTVIVQKSVLTIESSITKESFKILKGYNPAALNLVDADKNPVFTVAFTDEEPSISAHGVVLNPKRPIVKVHDKPIDEDFVKNEYGVALMKLGALEAQVEEAMQALNASVGQLSFDIVD